MFKRFSRLWLIPLALALAVGVYYLPPVHDRLAWRIDNWRAQVKYYFNPPDRAVFQPTQQAQVDLAVTQMLQTLAVTLTPQVTSTPRPGPTLKPTITATPLSASVNLKGFKYEDQHNRWNYCGPANFSMAMNFWGWKGNRDVVGKAVKPSDKDKNVMPYEFQDYIEANVPALGSVMRYGGDVDLVRRFLAAGFPVVAEKGYYEKDYTGKLGWMGHYQFITGYDDSKRELIVQDTYNDGPNFRIDYEKFTEGWRSFNYLFVVVYPKSREADVMKLLGPLSDEAEANKRALALAQFEGQRLVGIDRFFAWFNVGTSDVALQDYAGAAIAYDYAFNLYANLDDNQSTRPYRIMWYETGPYKAYYYTSRFADVKSLADTTLKDTVAEPVLEESLLWRGRAEYMSGNTKSAISDYRAALKVHPKWAPAMQALQDLGVKP